MKIGIYDPYLDDLGGGEKYMMTLAKCLADEHDVSIFWDNKEDLTKLKKRFLLDLTKIKLVRNIFSSATSFLERINQSRKYDSIILLSDGSVPFLFSKKTFLHIQQPLPGRLSLKTRLKLKRINKVFCNSYYTKSHVDEFFGINTEVLYPPVDLKPEKMKKENIILTVGRFRVKNVLVGGGDYKKQSFLVEVFKKMVKNGLKDWKFVLAVSVKDEDKGEFENLKKSTIGFPIEFLLNKNNDELWLIYSKAKIYWHASGFGEDLKQHPEYAEHFGISTVEAMGAGAVPVAINAGGQKEIVEDGKSGFLWNTQDELIDKTKKIIESKELLEKLSEGAVKRAGRFAGNRFCIDLQRVLNI